MPKHIAKVHRSNLVVLAHVFIDNYPNTIHIGACEFGLSNYHYRSIVLESTWRAGSDHAWTWTAQLLPAEVGKR
jgi:hypothetical protein